MAAAGNSSAGDGVIILPVQMRVPPTSIEFLNMGTIRPGVSSTAVSNLLITYPSVNTTFFSYTSSNGASAGDSVLLNSNNTTNAFVGLNAEL
jgi:hypothetical protein